jgi:hypothetical protein
MVTKQMRRRPFWNEFKARDATCDLVDVNYIYKLDDDEWELFFNLCVIRFIPYLV